MLAPSCVTPAADRPWQSRWLPRVMPLSTARPLAAVVVAAVALGWFCSWLNALHYRTHAPFYDSLSYTITLHELMTTAREAGIPAALAAATTADTVFLPHLPAVLLGPFLDPSRSVGVWIQVIELAVLCGSLIAYLMRVERFTGRTAALACGAVLLMARLWRPHGGLSDFRMDFGLMAGYWTVAAWYLISRASLRRVDFLILGLACGAACLMRATAPVYILCGMGPLVIADLARLPGRGRRLGGWLLAAAVATLTGAWFYVLNRDFLYYYYVVWNGDAQAGLGLLESWGTACSPSAMPAWRLCSRPCSCGWPSHGQLRRPLPQPSTGVRPWPHGRRFSGWPWRRS